MRGDGRWLRGLHGVVAEESNGCAGFVFRFRDFSQRVWIDHGIIWKKGLAGVEVLEIQPPLHTDFWPGNAVSGCVEFSFGQQSLRPVQDFRNRLVGFTALCAVFDKRVADEWPGGAEFRHGVIVPGRVNHAEFSRIEG